MQGSWKQLKSDTSWQNILTSSYNLQSQWHVVRKLYQRWKINWPEVGFEGAPKLDPCDNSHSWVGISHGLIKLVTDLIDKEYDDNEQETSDTKTEVFAFASRSKAKAKPRRLSITWSSSRTVPILERTGIDIVPRAQFDQTYPVTKTLNTLLRHGELLREEDRAIEFWRLKDDLRNKFEYSQYWSDDVWKRKMSGGGGNKKRFQYCTDPSGQEILDFRALQSHSGRNRIDLSLQDYVLIPNNFFEYIYHIGCAVSLHSVANSGLIPEESQGSARAW